MTTISSSADVVAHVEPLFTDALIRRFERSQVAHVISQDDSPVILNGTIIKVETIGGAAENSRNITSLPGDAVLITDYRIRVTTSVILKRKSDEKVIWQGSFANEKVYRSPRIGTAVVNSADATYNQSARIQAIAPLAEEMMVEAHDRITENY